MSDPIVPQRPEDPARLADFIRMNIDPIVEEWVTFARTRRPASEGMTHLALQDHIVELLTFITDDIESAQTEHEQVQKSRGLGSEENELTRSAAEIHAALRLADGFNIDQMVSEYRALRASVVKQWTAANNALSPTDLEDLTRFNEAIDQAMTESVAEYTKMINRSRDLFLGVLGHDLRNPIGAAWMSAKLMAQRSAADSRDSLLASQIALTMERATSILNDLLELTRSAFGSDIPISRTSMNMAELGTQLVEEARALSKGRNIQFIVLGDTDGEWDRQRLGQVISNLIGNALQYSPSDSVVDVTISGRGDHVVMSVHNDGPPIPPDKRKSIFKSLTRGATGATEGPGSTNLGLGLFIAHKIVTAHGGSIEVESAKETGTTFTAILPKKPS